MKKLYTTSKASVVNDFKNSCSLYRLLFIKALSLASVIIFLSNISPVSANTQIFNNISSGFSGGTNVLKAIPPAYVVGSKLYKDSGSAFIEDEDAFKNLNPNIKFQTQLALDTAFAGRESSKDEDSFRNINPNIKFQTQPALDTALTGKESSKKESSKNVADAFSSVKSAFTSLNHQLELAEIKNPPAIEEKQNNLSQGHDQHKNIEG
ncbi:hypothetical protein, partial [Bartonella sp. TS82HLJMH]|uniref:hypothetical protein n=1 Tax=Bartonella sp. TS82HLJMH TaxID=3243577 RepID=UPI0035CEA213